jgi:hypothetical protein
MSPLVFYAGLGTTAVLATLTIWSGFDALSAKNKAFANDPTYDPGAVRSKALRTDVFLIATALAAGSTAFAGLRLVEWGVAVSTSGAALSAHGRF